MDYFGTFGLYWDMSVSGFYSKLSTKLYLFNTLFNTYLTLIYFYLNLSLGFCWDKTPTTVLDAMVDSLNIVSTASNLHKVHTEVKKK